MTLQKRDEITEKCTVYLSSKAWQKHFMGSGSLTWSIEIHECIVIIEGLDDCGRCTVRFEFPFEITFNAIDTR